MQAADVNDEPNNSAHNSTELIDTLRELSHDIERMELEQRSYFLSGDPLYLDAFKKLVAELRTKSDELKTLVSDDPVQDARMVILEPLIQVRMIRLARAIETWQAGDHGLALSYLKQDNNQAETSNVQNWMNIIINGERRLLRDRSLRLRESHQRLEVLLIGSIAVSAMIFIGILKLLLRDVERGKLTASRLMRLKEEAERASHAKSDFLAVMSHEVRTPLNGIIGMNGLLLETPLGKLQRQYVGAVQVSSESMLKIVNNLLDFSKLEAGRLEMEMIEFDLCEVVDRVIEMHSVAARNKRLALAAIIDPSLPSHVVGDPTMLRQILLNLVGNAVKFTQQGQVVLNLRRENTEPSALIVCFEASDTGSGISEESKQYLFQDFEQLDPSVARRYGGTGLGLAICRRMVELMGGTIQVESRLGEGTTFQFTITLGQVSDLAMREPAEIAAALLSQEPLKGKRVLLVDDEIIYLQAMSALLQPFDLDITTARSGKEALDILYEVRATGSRPFDLVILDDEMNGPSGLVFAGRIRMADVFGDLKIILTSVVGAPDPRDQARRIGIDDVLVKPVKRSSLTASLYRVLGVQEPLFGQAIISSVPQEVRPISILLAEDNEVNQLLMISLLSRGGHRTKVARNGEHALREALENAYDLIFMDIEMPVVNGVQAARLIRKSNGLNAHTPIIALTAHAGAATRDEILAAGMQECLTKPIRPELLYDLIAAYSEMEIEVEV